MDSAGKQFRKRNAILAYMRQSKEHPSADMIYEALCKAEGDISRASVYRNLSLFEEQGLIVSVGTVNGIERFDARLDPHIHFACKSCGAVEDIPELELPEEISRRAGERLACRIDSARLMLHGVCKKCISIL